MRKRLFPTCQRAVDEEILSQNKIKEHYLKDHQINIIKSISSNSWQIFSVFIVLALENW